MSMTSCARVSMSYVVLMLECYSIESVITRRAREIPSRGVGHDDLSLRARSASARGGDAARRGAGVPAPDGGGANRQATRTVVGWLRSGVQPQGWGAGLDRHEVAEAVRRARAQRARALCGARGDAGGGRPRL